MNDAIALFNRLAAEGKVTKASQLDFLVSQCSTIEQTNVQLALIEERGRAAAERGDILKAEKARELYRGLLAHRRTFAGPEKCWRCQSGTYVWGAIVNGQPQFAGPCFRCEGTGVKPATGWWGRENGN